MPVYNPPASGTAYGPLALKAIAMAGGFAPGKELTAAVATALATSGGDPSYNSGGRIGLWGLTAGTGGYTAKQLASPPVNALAAHALYAKDGGQFTAASWPAWSSGAAQQEVTALGNDWHWSPAAPTGSSSGSGGGDFWSGFADGLNPVNVATGGLANTVGGLTGTDAIGAQFDKAAAWITNPSNWLHIGYVVLGGALVLGGLIVIARPAVSGTANTVTKVATGSTSVGRAAKAVGRVQQRRAAAAGAAQQRTRREAERTHVRARTQQRIEERHQMARNREARAGAREARAAERHAKTKEKDSDGD